MLDRSDKFVDSSRSTCGSDPALLHAVSVVLSALSGQSLLDRRAHPLQRRHPRSLSSVLRVLGPGTRRLGYSFLRRRHSPQRAVLISTALRDPTRTQAHIYRVARDAYLNAVEDKVHQNVLVTGDSGAGKDRVRQVYFAIHSEGQVGAVYPFPYGGTVLSTCISWRVCSSQVYASMAAQTASAPDGLGLVPSVSTASLPGHHSLRRGSASRVPIF